MEIQDITESINKDQCIDCKIILDTEEAKENGAICDGCLAILCEECVITDNECYECSECFDNGNGA